MEGNGNSFKQYIYNKKNKVGVDFCSIKYMYMYKQNETNRGPIDSTKASRSIKNSSSNILNSNKRIIPTR